MTERFARVAGSNIRMACFAIASLLVVGAPPISAQGQTPNAATVIHISVDETHDMLTPEVVRGDEWIEEHTITLSGENGVSATVERRLVKSGAEHFSGGVNVITRGSDRGVIGENDGKIVWHVLGPQKLQRIFSGVQFISIMNIEIDRNDRCRVDVKYLLQQGYSDIVQPRAFMSTMGAMEHFTLPRVKTASCSIETQASGQPAAAHPTVIHATVDETHIRLPPYFLPNIEWIDEYTFTLSGKNHVSEKEIDKAVHGPEIDVERGGSFGGSGSVVWHVLSPNKLERIKLGAQFIITMDLEIGEDKSCRIAVKYLLQTGHADVVMMRADNGTMAHFTLPSVKRAACSIES